MSADALLKVCADLTRRQVKEWIVSLLEEGLGEGSVWDVRTGEKVKAKIERRRERVVVRR
jgi:hypothetical protein